jgi:oligopeptide transport system permease protein
MAVKEQAAPPTTGVTLQRREAGFWSDASRRLVRNKAAVVGGIVIILFFLMAIFAPLIAPYSYEKQILVDNNAAPLWVTKVFPSMIPIGEEGGYIQISDKYPLGADDVGRDLLSRIIYGSRVSLSVAIVGPLISLMIGVTFGMIAGYLGGRTDNIMMRFVDVMYAFPTLLLIILLMAFFRSTTAAPEPGTLRYYLVTVDNAMGGMLFIFIGIGITAWMSMARLTRGQILSLKEREFIESAHSIGVRDTRIMRRHVLPNIIGPIIVAETLAIPTYIAYEAFLSFIGLGVNRPTPSWGSLISDGSRVIRTYPNQVIFPALALAIIMFAFNFLGDGLRDALDPRLRGSE